MFLKIHVLVNFRERGKEALIHCSAHPHSLIESCMCQLGIEPANLVHQDEAPTKYATPARAKHDFNGYILHGKDVLVYVLMSKSGHLCCSPSFPLV